MVMKRRIISLFLALILLMSLSPAVFAADSSFINSAWLSKGYLPEYQGLYTIDVATGKVVLVASYVFDNGTYYEPIK